MCLIRHEQNADYTNVFGTCTNRSKFETKLESIKLLKKRTKDLEKAIIMFNSGKVKDTIDYLIKIEAITLSKASEQLNDT